MLDNRLLTFIELCETGSFTRTAENLHLTQPAVSQQIRSLENYYEIKIYEYSNHQFSLTPAGKYLFTYAVSISADSKLLKEKLKSISQNLHKIKFGVEVTASESFMPKVLASFVKKYPDCKASMKIQDTNQLQHMLQTGGLDFLILDDSFPKSEYEYYELYKDTTLCVCSVNHPLAGQHITISDLMKETLIARSKDSAAFNNLDYILQKNRMSISQFHSFIEIDSVAASKQVLKQNIGIAFFYKCIVDDELADGTLSQIYIEDFSYVHYYDFVIMKNSFFKDESLLFFNFCKDYLKQYCSYIA